MTVENLEIKVTTDAGKAAEQFNSLSKALEGIQSSAGDVGKKAKKATEPLGDAIRTQIEEAGRYEIALHKVQVAEEKMLKAFQKGNENSAWRAREQGLNAEAAAEKYAPKVPLATETQEMIEAASAMEVLQAKAESLNAALQQAFASGDQDKAYALRGQIIKVNEQMERLENAAKKAAEAEKQTANATEKVANAAKKANKPLGNFISSLKRIAFYRIIRGIIKGITQAFSEGLEKAYLFSSGIVGEGNRFAQAMDSIKSKGNEMKGQLGSAFISLLTAIEPILIQLINLITKVADALSQLFAAFTGRTYIKANQTAAKFADTMARGGAAAKEWKNQLLGFDEINRLNEPNQGGGGGGANPLDGYDFEASPINEKILAFVEKLKVGLKWVKNHMDAIKDVLLAVGIAFAALKLGTLIANILGVGSAFAAIAVPVGLLTAGVVMLVLGFKEWLQTGELTEEAARRITIGFLAIGTAISILTGSWIPLLIAGVLSLILNWDKFKNKLDEWHDKLQYALTDGKLDWADFALATVDAIRTVIGWVETLIGWIRGAVEWLDRFAERRGITAQNSDPYQNQSLWLEGFASGGFPTEGQLFFANEAGPELVGTMGGRSAVANQQEIVEGIRQGVYDAVVSANANGNSDVSVKVYLDSREIRAGQERLARAWG